MVLVSFPDPPLNTVHGCKTDEVMRRQPQGAKAGRANAETEARKELLESDTPPSTLRQRSELLSS